MPFFRLQRAAEDFQLGFVLRQEAGKKVRVETIQALDRVANSKAGMKIEKKMDIAERTREIKEHGALLGVSGQLNAEVYGDRSRADAALRTHDGDQLLGGAFLAGTGVLAEPSEQIHESFGVYGPGDEVLHAAAHGVQEQLLIGRIGSRAGNQMRTRAKAAEMSRQTEIGFRIAGKIQEDDIGDGLPDIRKFLHGHRPVLDGAADQAGLLQARQELARCIFVAACDGYCQHSPRFR